MERLTDEERANVEPRFMDKIQPEPTSGCWLWGSTMTKGYGQIRVGKKSVGTLRYGSAHRVSYTLFRGPIPDGMQVCHRCDNPACVNPDHLFLGTPLANMQDKHDKGRDRYARGEECTQAKLTANDVRQIRSTDEPNRQLASRYNVSEATIRRARKGVSWKHVE